MVCPYSFEVAGGVQFHVRDLAECLLGRGHEVSVLAPAEAETPLPEYVEACGRALPIPYNGSVARLTFGPMTAARVNRWVEAGAFDVVHIHEPLVPSVSVLALWAATGPIVATFHTSLVRSRAMQAGYPLVRSSMEKIRARIAVSEAARQTLTTHMGGDAIVIPNGVFTDRFAAAPPHPPWQGRPGRPTVAFLGRIDEPRKGLPVLLEALPALLERHPGVRVFVAGHGDLSAARDRLEGLGPAVAAAVDFLGAISEEQKRALLASVDVYVAPHTGGESFGIVLVEAMAAGAPVVASDLPAFAQVLDGGRAGAMFATGDAAALADRLAGVLADSALREQLARLGRTTARRYDWGVVAGDVVAVYETVLAGAVAVPPSPWSVLGAAERFGARRHPSAETADQRADADSKGRAGWRPRLPRRLRRR
nr:glycosyltransferase family 4 protein [Kineosphaera limosa]